MTFVRLALLCASGATAALFIACGGGPSGPSPLSHTLDDFHIAPVPVDSKGAVITSKQDLDVSQMERAKTQSDMAAADTQLQVARNDAASAQLQVQSAETRKQAALKTANVTSQNEAEKDLHLANLAKKVADTRIEYLEAKQRQMLAQVRWHDWDVSSKEAKWQLEKARIASRNNIRPPGFVIANYERQHQERNDGAMRSRNDADNAGRDVESKQKAWTAAQQKLEQARSAGQPGAAAPQ